MKRLPFVAGLLLAFLCFSTTARAEYLSSEDITVDVSAPVDVAYADTLATTTFDAQEGTHDLVTDTSGQEVDHYYIWLSVNGEPVAAVDPLCSYEFDKK